MRGGTEVERDRLTKSVQTAALHRTLRDGAADHLHLTQAAAAQPIVSLLQRAYLEGRMVQAERSAHAPSESTRTMDARISEYLSGRASLESAVNACVTALGPRPTLSIGVAHPDAQVQGRLDALQLVLGELRAGPR